MATQTQEVFEVGDYVTIKPEVYTTLVEMYKLQLHQTIGRVVSLVKTEGRNPITVDFPPPADRFFLEPEDMVIVDISALDTTEPVTIDTLTAKLARAEAALKPFAKAHHAFKEWQARYPDYNILHCFNDIGNWYNIEQDYEAAAKVLADNTSQPSAIAQRGFSEEKTAAESEGE